MVELYPQNALPELVQKVEQTRREAARTSDSRWRPHLGASIIGRPCDREIWYSFRWVKDPVDTTDGQLLRLFERGQLEEERFVSELRALGNGIEILDKDPRTGEQFTVWADWQHFGGSMDGCGRNIPYRGKEWHVLEFKTHNSKSFNKLRTDGVRVAKFEHYAQMQTYMRLTGMRRALYCAVCKETDELYYEVVYFDEVVAHQLAVRAEKIVFDPVAPARISDSPDSEKCQWCSYKDICFKDEQPVQNCRTCKYSRPERDGEWRCKFNFNFHYPDVHCQVNEVLDHKAQLTGCEEYRMREDIKS